MCCNNFGELGGGSLLNEKNLMKTTRRGQMGSRIQENQITIRSSTQSNESNYNTYEKQSIRHKLC